jgi:hypothetical protein
MNLPPIYIDLIAEALAKLRPGQPAFVAKDRDVIYGKGAAATLALPASTQKADCVEWIQNLADAALVQVAENLVGLTDDLRTSIKALVRFHEVRSSGSLVTLGVPLVVNRFDLLSNVSELYFGKRRMLRVWGERGTGKTFTGTVVEALLGAPAGSDQRVITIDLSSYVADHMTSAVTDILGAGIALPDRGAVAEKKYPETLAQFVVRRLIDTTTGSARTWVVFDRCRVAEEASELGSFLKYVAATVIKHQLNTRCPRVVFLEATKELLGRYRKDMVEEELDTIDDDEIREYCEARVNDAARVKAILAKVKKAIDGKDGGERSELIQATLEEELP